MTQPASAENPLAGLLELARRARHAQSAAELAFMAVNDTHELVPYRQAALWFADHGLHTLSGVVQIEANAPYALWLEKVCRAFAALTQPQSVGAIDAPEAERAQWNEWLPEFGLWLPLATNDGGQGGLLLARDLPWSELEIGLLNEWLDTWRHAWRAQHRPPRWSWRRLHSKLKPAVRDVPLWRTPAGLGALAALIVCCIPVKLTVLAPGELVPAHPAVVRAPLDGVIESFQVQPNQMVRKDQPLFGFDEALIQAKLAVARQAMGTAEAEYRQTLQQALGDARSKSHLAVLNGKIEERRAEAQFAEAQLARARVVAPRAGIALFDDPSEWTGRPVTVGERIMRIADPADVEIEAWVPVGDAIPLPTDARVDLYLNASPLAPVAARVRYLAHDAAQRPDGSFAYRLRATLVDPTAHRVGLKGTAKLQGERVPLIYWVLRRPWASLRTHIGW